MNKKEIKINWIIKGAKKEVINTSKERERKIRKRRNECGTTKKGKQKDRSKVKNKINK